MADFTIKSNDRLPSIQATLTDVNGSIPPLTGATVKFIMRLAGSSGTPKVAALASADPATGIVRYDWAPGDTNTPGRYQGEWEVTYASGKEQTFPTLTYHDITVLADLDNV
ncbi:MAG: hypothetical protein ACXVYY_01370 [Oryzihumus sp.]